MLAALWPQRSGSSATGKRRAVFVVAPRPVAGRRGPLPSASRLVTSGTSHCRAVYATSPCAPPFVRRKNTDRGAAGTGARCRSKRSVSAPSRPRPSPPTEQTGRAAALRAHELLPRRFVDVAVSSSPHAGRMVPRRRARRIPRKLRRALGLLKHAEGRAARRACLRAPRLRQPALGSAVALPPA